LYAKSFFFEENTVGEFPTAQKNLIKPKGVYVQAVTRGKEREEGGYHYIKRYSPKTN
jgi:hypothetical protein